MTCRSFHLVPTHRGGTDYPDALRLDFTQAVEAYPSFDRDPTYVLYCEFGLKSAHLAEMMRREGFDALAVHGGIGALKRTVA